MIKQFKGEIYLMLAAAIWGTAFVFQKMGMDYVGPFTFGVFRFGLGALALLPVIWFLDGRQRRKTPEEAPMPFGERQLLAGSLWCGLSNFVAGSLQQIALVYTTAGKAGFITSLYIVIVPIIMFFLRQRVGLLTWIGVAVGAFGLYLLCVTKEMHIQIGDSFALAAAVCYAFQILLTDYYASRVDPFKLSFLQFMLASLLSLITAVLVETIDLHAIWECAVPILYTAILEVSIAFTLQVVGQKYTKPAIASQIMALEAVFAAIAGAVALGEIMSGRELAGCVIMFASFILPQIPDVKKEIWG